MMPDPTSYQSIGWLVVALAAVLHMIGTVVKIRNGLKPQPPYIEQFASKNSVIDIRARIEALEDRELACKSALTKEFAAKEEITRLEKERHEWRLEVNEKLDELLQRTAHLVGYGKAGTS